MVYKCLECESIFREPNYTEKHPARMNCSNDDAMEAEHEGACPHCGAVENYTEADDVWKCYDCQKEFDEPVSEGIPMSMVLTAESREVCPHCQSDNIEEGVEPEVTV